MNKYYLEEVDKVYYMNIAMVSEYLHVAKSTIYKWAESGFIPHNKLGKHLLFIKNQVDEWVLNNGEVVKDLPEVPKFTGIEKDNPEETHSITIREYPPVHKNLIVKYRAAG
jgi:excisionase family DNA binding protein